MSLALAAKHLESQGRGKDTQLVHMTPNELRALNKLSLDQSGKPLSINPKTGLAEAGILDSILPTVAGIALNAAFPGYGLLIAGGVGLAATALTGDIGQGIMAGLGAWSGGKLASDIAGASTLAQQGVDTGAKAFNATADAALKSTMEPFSETLGRSFTVDPVKSFAGQSFTPTAASTIADQAKSFVPSVASTAADQAKSFAPSLASTASFPQGTAFPSFSAPPTALENFSSGLGYATSNPMEFLSRPGVGFNTAMALSPLALAALQPNYGKIPTASQDDNPFGLKRLDKDFKGSFPTQPNPYYTAQYPDYRARPYGMNNGGLADVEKFKSGGYKQLLSNISLMQEGLAGLEPDSTPAPITPTDPGYKYSPKANAVGIALDDEREFEGMSPDQRAYAMMKSIRKRALKDDLASGLQPVGALGNIDLDPAMVRDAKLAAQAKQQIAQEAKSGGLMDSHLGDYSDGGRLLKGPGDGVSDSIPATIGGKQAARLAEGEFVIPARIVSELGNGSTDAGAKRLYAMMDRVKAKRRKAKDIAADTKAYKLLPA